MSIEHAKQQLEYVRELRQSEAFRQIFQKELLTLQEKHNRAVKDRDKSPEKRAEHIEAAHMADELVGRLDLLEKSYQQTITAEKKK
jgi:hypothetical protein